MHNFLQPSNALSKEAIYRVVVPFLRSYHKYEKKRDVSPEHQLTGPLAWIGQTIFPRDTPLI